MPAIERILDDPRIEKLANLASVLDERMVEDLQKLIPLLEKIPSDETLQALNANMERIPPPEEMAKMIDLMEGLSGLAKAMGGGGVGSRIEKKPDVAGTEESDDSGGVLSGSDGGRSDRGSQ